MTGALTPVWNRHVNLNIATTDSHAPDARTLSGTRVNPAVQSPARHGRSIRACSMANEWLGMGEVLCPPRRSHRRRSSVTSWNRSLDDVIGRVMRGTHPRASLHNQCAESDPKRFRLGLADGRGSVFPSAAGVSDRLSPVRCAMASTRARRHSAPRCPRWPERGQRAGVTIGCGSVAECAGHTGC